ncbi:hypothetical protein QJS66_22475 [Kocuria rhizophila]|nr:hypothetical protein QJS66_22475 [Kocuria rhizophila]
MLAWDLANNFERAADAPQRRPRGSLLDRFGRRRPVDHGTARGGHHPVQVRSPRATGHEHLVRGDQRDPHAPVSPGRATPCCAASAEAQGCPNRGFSRPADPRTPAESCGLAGRRSRGLGCAHDTTAALAVLAGCARWASTPPGPGDRGGQRLPGRRPRGSAAHHGGPRRGRHSPRIVAVIAALTGEPRGLSAPPTGRGVIVDRESVLTTSAGTGGCDAPGRPAACD